MAMAAEIFAGIGAFKQMFDMARALKDMNDQNVRIATAIDLQQKILEAQEQQAALARRNAELESTVAAFERWETESGRYQLVDYGGGTFAYELKADAANGEPIHRLCPACFSRRRKSILQFDAPTATRQDRYNCSEPECKAQFEFGHRQQRVQHQSPRRGSTWMGA
jgi:hypothetical protein